MQKWEYKWLIREKAEFTSTLEVSGQEGWELVSVVASPVISKEAIFFFKRPLPLEIGFYPVVETAHVGQ